MMMKQKIIKQIENITSSLIKVGLSVEQNFPSSQNGSIYINGKQDLSIALKNISYKEIYTVLEKDKNYNIKMIDGALIQFMYLFEEDKLIKYRLAFFPSPSLEEFQNNSEIYEIDEIYADVITPITLLRKIAAVSKRYYLLESVEGGEKWRHFQTVQLWDRQL